MNYSQISSHHMVEPNPLIHSKLIDMGYHRSHVTSALKLANNDFKSALQLIEQMQNRANRLTDCDLDAIHLVLDDPDDDTQNAIDHSEVTSPSSAGQTYYENNNNENVLHNTENSINRKNSSKDILADNVSVAGSEDSQWEVVHHLKCAVCGDGSAGKTGQIIPCTICQRYVSLIG